MRKKIRVAFVDFWKELNPEDNLFLDILSEKYDIVLDRSNPEYLFYSVFGMEHFKYNCTKIFFSGENILPNYRECDYSLSFHFINNNRHYRLPLYVFFDDVNKLIKKDIDVEKIMREKTKFCNFIYSNPYCKKRNEFFKKLSKYKRVDSGGRVFNNIGFRPKDKIGFIKDYKFTIAFENEESEGYTTEKIFEPMLVYSIPIYWGNRLVHYDFNPKSFLNYYDYNSDEALIERIIEVDKDDSLFAKMLLEPYFPNNELNECVKRENILRFLERIVEGNKEPVSKKSLIFHTNPIIGGSALFFNKSKYRLKMFQRKIKYFSFRKLKMKLIKDNLEFR